MPSFIWIANSSCKTLTMRKEERKEEEGECCTTGFVFLMSGCDCVKGVPGSPMASAGGLVPGFVFNGLEVAPCKPGNPPGPKLTKNSIKSNIDAIRGKIKQDEREARLGVRFAPIGDLEFTGSGGRSSV